MSININWDELTTGPDGEALAETVREFIDAKFQQVTLPRFLKSLKVHRFEFGHASPEIEIRDIGDPLPDFYEDESDDEQGDEDDGDYTNRSPSRERREGEGEEASWDEPGVGESLARRRRRKSRKSFDRPMSIKTETETSTMRPPPPMLPPLNLEQQRSGSPLMHAGTPGIAGGTSNLNYFHSPLTAGLSGTHTPLAAVAGAHHLSLNGWQADTATYAHQHQRSESINSVSPPSTSHSTQFNFANFPNPSSSPPQASSTSRPITPTSGDADGTSGLLSSPPRPRRRPARERRVEDTQILAHVRYDGDIRLSLTAEILLDYPMPSFVCIPVRLNIVGASFDGFALLAHIHHRAHLCFVSPDEAASMLSHPMDQPLTEPGTNENLKPGGLLQEIKLESEIGQRDNGKQSLKNVGKVEKFILEQVRRIFEDEFVYPSYWTFLV